jgi:branched-chain amino acid transport system substrate-binding protein
MKARRLTAIIALFLGLAVAGGRESSAQGKIVQIGASLPLTGSLAREGAMAKHSYELWKDTVNAAGGLVVGSERYKVDIKYYDDKTDATTAARIVERLITVDGINLIIAPLSSGAVFAASSVAEKYRVPMVSGQAAAENIFTRGYKYIFSPMANTRDYQRSVLDLAATLNPKPRRVAVVWVNALFGESVAKSVQTFSTQHGMEIVLNERFDVGIKDFSSVLIKIGSTKPEVLNVIGYPAETTLFLRQMDENRVSVPLVTVSFGPTVAAWREAAGPAGLYVVGESQFDPKNTKFTGPVFGSSADFAKAFEARTGQIPGYDDANSAAAALAFGLAIEKAASVEPQKVRDALADLDVMTFVGRLRFNSDGSRAAPPLYAVQITSKETKRHPTFVYPPDVAEAALVFPRPALDKRQ